MKECNGSKNSDVLWRSIAFSFVPALSSSGFVQRYFGNVGVILYFVFCVFFFAVFIRIAERSRSVWEENRRLSYVLIGASLAFLSAVFLVVYPIANAGVIGGGSDRDDALNIAVQALLNGHYPYYIRTYLGNPISPLPGGIILAMPFVVILGNSAYQNLVWIMVYLLILRAYYRHLFLAGAVFILSFLAFPMALNELIAGGDLLANSIAVLLLVVMADRYFARMPTSVQIAFAVFSGIVFSWRANFMMIYPLIATIMWRRADLKSVLLYSSTAFFAFLAVTLPFWVYDLSGFTPLHAYSKLGSFDALVPGVGSLIPVFSFLLACVLSLHVRSSAALLRSCAIIQLLPVLAGAVFTSISDRHLDLVFILSYGLLFPLFWITGGYEQLESFEAERMEAELALG